MPAKRHISNSSRARAVNAEATLFEVQSREIWQCEVVSKEGITLGHAVQQIVEPRAYSVRYLVIYNTKTGRHLLPAALIADAEPNRIICDISAAEAAALPPYKEPLSRNLEEAVHLASCCHPYWQITVPEHT